MCSSKAQCFFCLLLFIAATRGDNSRIQGLREQGWTIPESSFTVQDAVPGRKLLQTNSTIVEPAAASDLEKAEDGDVPVAITRHYAEAGPGMFSNSSEIAIAEQSTENCKCIRSGERCIQIGFECLEKRCLRAEVQCEKIDTVCTQYVQQCHETQCIEWDRQCIEEISTCVEVHHDEELGTTCLRRATQCLKWGFSCSNSMCVQQSYQCMKRAAPICVSFQLACVSETCGSQEVKCQTPEKTCLEFEEGCEP